MDRKGGIFLLVFLVVLLVGINYKFLDGWVVEFLDEGELRIVERVIDGDTIVVDNDTHVRLLGINTPEKGEKYYQEAKDFLGSLVMNKTVKLEYGKERKDKYGRELAYIILDGRNVNSEIVREGFANPYVYDSDRYTNVLKEAWKGCVNSGRNLCEKSQEKCASCIELKELDVDDEIIVFYNKCDYCNLTGWSIKDEGRKKFIFKNFVLQGRGEVRVIVGNGTNAEGVLFWEGEEYVWTSGGDTLFLRDEEGKLVLWKNY